MARPTKDGLDYFPLDVQMCDKFEFIEAKHGLIGWGVIVKLFQKIYFEGYFITWSDKTALLFAKKNGIELTDLNEIIEDSLEDKLFNRDIFNEFNILTSRGIQTRYIEATKRRKQIKCVQQIALTDFNVNTNAVNVDINPYSKVKESKLKETKGKYGEFKNVLLEEKELEKLKERFTDYQDKIEKLSQYIENFPKKAAKYKSHYSTILTWARKDNGKGGEIW
jgi:hypothetical protein